MPAWVRKTLSKRTFTITSTTAIQIAESDPSSVNEIAAADSQKTYVNIETIQTTTPAVTIEVYRWEGARADLLKRLDPSGTPCATFTQAGVYAVDWPPGTAGAARKMTFDGKIASAGTGTVTFEVDDVYRTEGG